MPSSGRDGKDSNHSRKLSGISRSNEHHQKTAVRINVYDMSAPHSPRMARLAWSTGFGIYSSGVEVFGTEFSYGGDPYSDLSGVYTTTPRAPLSTAGIAKYTDNDDDDDDPSAALSSSNNGQIYTCRASFLHGFTYMNQGQIISAVRKLASTLYRAQDFDQLTHNANNFTSDLVVRLTGRPAPAWLNRYFRWANKVPDCCLGTFCSPPPLVFPNPLSGTHTGSAVSLHATQRHISSTGDAYGPGEDPTLGLSDLESSDEESNHRLLESIDSQSSDLSEDSGTELMGGNSTKKKTSNNKKSSKKKKNKHRRH